MSVWNQSGQPKMTTGSAEELARIIADMVVKGLSESRGAELIEQYKQMARFESELARERDLTARLRAEILNLQRHIGTLQTVLTTVTPSVAHTAQVPTFENRATASFQLPSLTEPPVVPTS